ncbi:MULTISPECIES: hypothetical protein [unclassified Oceanobacter]|uniref:hypothetical protein n=1 Tax=unclassified Oceanobacter TaxID=2620260 RepID=UPI0027369166|nr:MULTISPECIES: hypothetical protein [unclassified Oceanobacter]MDP2610337.1 hypothetical protein [Oceanobacter sp. 1_MG-2023]MDP2613714.1 hypothetical protein [Oceanobacter sp. 2_MG-2023]
MALSQRDSSKEVFCFFDDLDFAGALAIAETIPWYQCLTHPGYYCVGKVGLMALILAETGASVALVYCTLQHSNAVKFHASEVFILLLNFNIKLAKTGPSGRSAALVISFFKPRNK